MSIIYDALRKTQESIGNIEKSPKTLRSNKKLFPTVIAVFILIVTFLFSNKFFAGFTTIEANKTKTSKQRPRKNFSPGLYGAIDSLAAKDGFVLSGIAHDNNKSWVLINDKILREGDFINKAKITKISQSEVELSLAEDKKIILTANK